MALGRKTATKPELAVDVVMYSAQELNFEVDVNHTVVCLGVLLELRVD